MFYFGAQFYRPPNPAPEDWERDLAAMHGLGFNICKIWAMWTHIHAAEGKYDFSDFDRLMDLAKKHELKVVISLILENAPYWLALKHPESRYQANDGTRIDLMARPNTPGGGWPGLCLDHECVRKLAEDFMRTMAFRYREHPALYGYDVWDEAFFEVNGYFGNRRFCYCDQTVEQFRNWLRRRYKTVAGLSRQWYRRYTAWEEVEPPRFFGGYPDWIDWLKFRLETHHTLMHWRADALTVKDKKYTILSHGVAGTLGLLPTMYNDDWKNAEVVEQWGLSTFPDWNPHRDVCDHMLLNDITRCSSRGKPIWQNELQGGRVTACGEGDKPHGLRWGPVPSPADYRVWDWTSLMCGCRGIMYWQWRPEVLGPESPGFGLTGLDGAVNERTQEAAAFARFARAHPELEKALPVRGDLAIGIFNESQLFNYTAEGDTALYTDSLRGVYRALSQDGFQVDFAAPDQFRFYPCVYIPFPLMLEKESARTMTDYVSRGGILICEGCPAHFLEHGCSSGVVPGQGLDRLFGTGSGRIDSLENSGFTWKNRKVPALVHQQRLSPVSAGKLALYPDGSAAVTINKHGRGSAVLIGAYPGLTYHRTGANSVAAFLGEIVRSTGITPAVASGSHPVKTRLHRAPEADYLYVLNTDSKKTRASITVSPKMKRYRRAVPLSSGKNESPCLLVKNRLTISLDPRNGTVLKLT